MGWVTAVILPLLLLTGCQISAASALPTRVPLAALPAGGQDPDSGLPYTWTPPPDVASYQAPLGTLAPTRTPTVTPILPTRTPITPSPTPTITPTPTISGTITPTPKALDEYTLAEPLPAEVYPRPAADNGWGMHWIPTVSQEPAVVDKYVGELARMHIKWVVFLNDGTNIGANDYLVDQLVARGIMPVMRLYRSGIQPYDGDVGALVAHYRRRGVYYFQLYNEPNVNDENHQGSANPNVYAAAWADAAREVIANGGYPGLGALSPGGAYNHYQFLDRTLRAIKHNGDEALLNRAWLSAHNYHGTRAVDDPDGFLLFRRYDEIVRGHLHRSLPIIGTEGGSYSDDPHLEKELLIHQYRYLRDREPYYLAFSWWLLANRAGGSWDSSWEWQALFRPGFVHPAVYEFFYRYSR